MEDNANLSPQDRLANVKTAVVQNSLDELETLQRILKYYGKAGSV